MFYLFTLAMTKIHKNSPVYGVTMGLWLIASGTSPVTPRAQKPLQVLTKALQCSVEKLLLRGIFPCSAEHFSRIKQPEQRNTSEGEKKERKRKTLITGNGPDSRVPR